MNIKNWLEAFRLRTLPLALASILMGGFLAMYNSAWKGEVFVMCIVTTVLLQILSNLANDYGDTQNGADSADRVGPDRAVQSGAISMETMKKAIIVFVLLSLVSGLGLLYFAFGQLSARFWGLFALGIAAIVAAIKYTAGKKPYGYAGLGDISVMVFFGFAGVIGTYFAVTNQFSNWLILPAITCGCFAVGVLNLNNMRDIVSDEKAGKRTIPVRIGLDKAKIYHTLLLVIGIASFIVFSIKIQISVIYLPFLLPGVLLILLNCIKVWKTPNPVDLDPFLKQLALSALTFVLGVGGIAFFTIQ